MTDTELDEGVGLNWREARCLALLIAARHVADSDRWLDWEDYPELGEFAFQRLDEAMRTVVADGLHYTLGKCERMWDMDARLLLERAHG